MALRGMSENMMKEEAHLHNYIEERINKHDETLCDWRAGVAYPRWWTRLAHEFPRDGCCTTMQTFATLQDTIDTHDTK